MASTLDNWQRVAQYDEQEQQSSTADSVLHPSRRANNRQHSRASTFTLGMRRSLDFSTWTESNGKRHSRAGTAASNLSGSGSMAAAEPDGNSGSKWGTISTSSSSTRFGTVALGGSSNSNKRTRGAGAGFSLGGLFSPSKGSTPAGAGAFTGDATGSTPTAAAAAATGMEGEAREEALVQGIRATHDEHTPWEITILAIHDPDKLFQPAASATAAAVQSGPSEQLSASTSFSSNLVRMLSPGARDTKKRGLGWSNSSSSSSSSPRPQGKSTPCLLALCVSAGATTLTLYRTIAQVALLDAELRSHLSDAMPMQKPSILTDPSRATSPTSGYTSPSPVNGHSRKRSVLSTLARGFASPSKRASRPSTERATSPLHASQSIPAGLVSGASQTTFQTISDMPNSDVFAMNGSHAAPLQQPEVFASQLSNLGNYLSALSTIIEVRQSEAWKTFFTLQGEDSSSSHQEGVHAARQASQVSSLQRQPKRIKSEASLPLTGSPPVKKDASAQLGQSTGRLDDSGIGGDTSLFSSQGAGSRLSASGMQREASAATTGSSMSIFVEDVPSGAVGDPEVLAYMSQIAEGRSAERLPAQTASAKQELRADDMGNQEESRDPLHAHDWHSLKSHIVEQDEDPSTPARPFTPSKEQVEDIVEAPLLSGNTAVDPLVEDDGLADVRQSQIPPAGMQDEPTGPLTPTSEDEHASARIEEELEAHMVKLEKEVEARKAVAGGRSLSPKSTNQRGRSKAPSSDASIQDFEILRVLGKGCAGKVLLARHSQYEGQLYAIKAIHKKHVLAHRELAHTLTEQKILREVATADDNPFVVRLSWSFQDPENLFLVLDFHPGGDLATQLSRFGRLGKDRTRFYAAEIVQGLEGLHAAGVVYRDLKPENILLDAQGHIILTDFGLSKQFERRKTPLTARQATTAHRRGASSSRSEYEDEMTASFCGTAEYLAPEVLLGGAYSYPVDLWSLGTMIYEMLMGVTPFYNEDHGIMYRRVIHETLKVDDDYLDNETRALLRGLLQKDPEFRMTTARVKKCKYFEAIDWEYVHFKRYIPPFIPPLSSMDPADTQNFDECFLAMDTGFIDAEEDAEDAARLRSSGKEPDKPFDEQGRDVFANYGFSGNHARPDDDESEEEQGIEEEEVEEQHGEAVADNGSKIDHGELQQAGAVAERREESSESADSSPSTDDNNSRFRSDADNDHDGYETGLTSASVTDDDQSKHTKEASGHLRVLSSGLASLAEDTTEEYSSQTSLRNEKQADDTETAHERSTSPRMSLEYTPRETLASPVATEQHRKQKSNDAGRRSGEVSRTDDVRKSAEMARNSVDLPRMPMSATDSVTSPVTAESRISGEHDDWDMVESAPVVESARNGGRGGRKRVLAGPTLFARGGILDKYKMQMKPVLSRSNTPTRSYTSRTALNKLASIGSRQSSSTNVNQLSPSPSVGEVASRAPSVELPSPGASGGGSGSAQPRLRAPKLLRASTEWMSSSLPASPTPRFRIKRNKKATDASTASSAASTQQQQQQQQQQAKGSMTTLEAPRSGTPAGSVDSAATLPLEASNAALHPLTRVADREVVLDAE